LPPNTPASSEFVTGTITVSMPLHALRHASAATWLCGHPHLPAFGHASITTTESFYGHVEQSLLRQSTARTGGFRTSMH
jgi:hypothetical protein